MVSKLHFLAKTCVYSKWLPFWIGVFISLCSIFNNAFKNSYHSKGYTQFNIFDLTPKFPNILLAGLKLVVVSKSASFSSKKVGLICFI